MNEFANTPIDVRHLWQRSSLAMGVVCALASVIGGWFAVTDFFRAYLMVWLFFFGLSLGSLALVMIQTLTGGAWGALLRRIVEGQMRTLPWLAILFLPLALGLPYIYRWADVEISHDWRAWYLDRWFFFARAAVYFSVWISLSLCFSRWSLQQERTADAAILWKRVSLAGPGLLILGVTLHFAAIDWVMSLQMEFTSTVLGPLLFAAMLVTALASAVLLFTPLAKREEFSPILSSSILNDLGSLLLTFVMLWAYLMWFQYMLIWMADLPRGSAWYLVRSRFGWRAVAWLLVLGHGVVPISLLLLRSVKQSLPRLAKVALLLLAMQMAFDVYLVLPAFSIRWATVLLSLGLLFAFGGLWLAGMLAFLRQRSLVVTDDRDYEHALELHHRDAERQAREERLAHD
jgi:hypothetical protein